MLHPCRSCAVCGGPIPDVKRADALACSRLCRDRKHNRRRAELVALARASLT